MSPLALVKDERNPEVLSIIKQGGYTLTGLEKRFGISQYLLKTYYGAQSRGRGRPKQPKPFSEPKKLGRPPKDKTQDQASAAPAAPLEGITIPTNKVNDLTEETPSKEITLRPSRAPFVIGMVLIGFGIAAGVDGAFINWRYFYAFGGQDWQISMACGVIGIVGDAGATFFLPAFGILFKRGSWWTPVALVAWVLFQLGSSYASLGFVGVSLGDAMQARKDPPTQRELLTAQLHDTIKLRNAIEEVGDQKVLENLMNAALGAVPKKNLETSDNCKKPTPNFSADVCKDYVRLKGAWTAAKSRDEDKALIDSLMAQIKLLPPIGSVNPAAEQLEQITGGKINQEQASNYQVRWLAVIPGSSSILITLGLALL